MAGRGIDETVSARLGALWLVLAGPACAGTLGRHPYEGDWPPSRFGAWPTAQPEAPDTRTWDGLVRTADSPAAICAGVRVRVRYRADRDVGDEWKTAARTWSDAAGDCEDFAACVVELCRLRGFPARIAVVANRTQRIRHAVATGQWQAANWVSSNGEYTLVGPFEDLATTVARRQGWGPADLVVTEGAHP